MKNSLTLYRKRYIPNETVCLKDDIILFESENLIITKWNTLKPRLDISHGISAYFIDRGFKVSKIYNKDNHLVYWYCDIIEAAKDTLTNSLVIQDLLIDIVVYEDGKVRVLDLVEVSDSLEQGIIDTPTAAKALRTADTLLNIIYSGEFKTYQTYINDIE